MTNLMKYLKYKKKYIELKTQLETQKLCAQPSFIEEKTNSTRGLSPTQMYGGDGETIIVNMMWMYNKINDNKYIFPEKHKELDVVEVINMWLDKDYKIYFWYDSTMTTPEQIANTHDLFKDKNMTLRDIRPIMEEYSKIFECLIYTIVDFCRLVVLQHLINTEFYNYYIYTDLLIKPKEQIDFISHETLNNFQILLSAKKKGEQNIEPYENNFIAIKHDDIIKKNLNNFINATYDHIIIKKQLSGYTDINCKNYDEGRRQVFFEVLPILIFMQIEEIFYNRNTLYPNIYNILNMRNDITYKFKNIHTSILPIKEKILPFFQASQIKRIKQNKPIDEAAIQKIIDSVPPTDINYVYPIIDLDRPLISGKY